MPQQITVERVRELFSYSHETGHLVWRVGRRGPARPGLIAGSVHTNMCGRKYRVIKLQGRRYLAHRLVWLHVHGVWPTNWLDHRDGDGLNNKLGNLREATKSENGCNRGAQANNTSGLKGVRWHKPRQKWLAQIGYKGRKRHLGLFDTPEQAHAAYCRAAIEYHGSFARAH